MLEPKLNQAQKFAIDFFSQHIPLEGNILEIGSDANCAVASTLADRGAKVTAMNPDPQFKPPSHIESSRDDARDMHFADEFFDAIVSVNTFEHIHALHVALNEMHRILKPGGYLATLFGPLFSSAKGHHIWAKDGNDIVSFCNPNYRNPLYDYSHLLLSPSEMRAYLLGQGERSSMVEKIVHAVYRGDYINRMMYADYLNCFEQSQFDILYLEPHRNFNVPADLAAKLRARWGNHDFGISSFRLVARRPPQNSMLERDKYINSESVPSAQKLIASPTHHHDSSPTAKEHSEEQVSVEKRIAPAPASHSMNATVSQNHFLLQSAGSQNLTNQLAGIVNYYSRWPLFVAIFAIFFNVSAFLLDAPFQWIFAASSTTLLLFLFGHTAAKADALLSELRQTQMEQKQATVNLRRRVKNLALRQQRKRNNH